MSKARNTGNLNNSIQISPSGDIMFVHDNNMLMAISSSGTIVTTGVISGSNALSASYAASASNADFSITSTSASYAINATNAVIATTASFIANAQSASNAVIAQTASYANALTVAGTLTAQTLVVQTITSSVDFVTGSTRFGSIAANTHQFTGSVLVSGSVGIGISSPTELLEVSTILPRIKITSTTNTNNAGLYFSTKNSSGTTQSGGVYYTPGSTPYVSLSGDNNNSHLVVTSAGNVGIGITSLSDKLHISASDTSGILITGGTNGRKVALHGSSINFYTTTTPAGYAMGHYILKGSDSSVLAAISGVYGSQDTADYTFYGGTAYNDAAMYIASKKVGIGISSPSDTLHVVGSSRWGSAANNLVSFADGGGVYMELTGTNSNQRQLRIQGINNSLNRYSSIRLEAGIEEIAFTTADTERMRIKSNGAVIRQHQPAFLAYSSDSGFNVTGGGWYNISNAMTVESYDIGSNYSGGRFTAPVAGRYFFYAGGWANISSNGERYAFSVVINSGGYTFISGGNYCIADSPLSGYSVVYNLNAGDYVDLFAFSAVSGNWGSGTHRAYFGGYLL